LLLVATAAQAKSTTPSSPPKGEAEFRAGWLAFIAPARESRTANSVEARQKARAAAITQFEAAVAANPKNPVYQASLAYVCLAAAKYEKGKTAINLAIDVERRDPLLYLLRGQAEAALAQMDPASAGANIGKAIDAFDRAAQLDPKNSLPLLQAVSVALFVDRLDLAEPRLKQALERPECRLYGLPVPSDLEQEKAVSLQLWQQIQLSYWLELLTRCQDATNAVLRLGAQEEKLGNPERAEALCRQAYGIGRAVGRIQPQLFLSVGMAIDILERVYPALAKRAKERKEASEAERWEGELGVLQIGRAELQAAVRDYFASVKANPPGSIEELLARETEYVGKVYRGIGLGTQTPESAKPRQESSPRDGAASGKM
jgi:hypothetical protein